MGQTEQPVLEAVVSPPLCHPRASHGAPQWVLTMGCILGWGSPSIWDAGAVPGAGLERCRAVGGPGKPPSLPEQSTRGCARHRGTCTWTQHRGYNHGGSTRSHAHPGHDRARPARAPAPSHPRVDTLPTCTYPRLTRARGCTEPFRATRCLTEPFGALPDLTEPHGSGAEPPRARAHSFIHPLAPWERAARAAGGKRSPALAPPSPRV